MEFFMYTTEQFEKDVQGLRDLIRMCDELEKENDRKTNALIDQINGENAFSWSCLLYTSPSPRDLSTSRMPSSA